MSNLNALQHYIHAINKLFATGITTEHSFRGDLQNLLNQLLPDFHIINEPKRRACGAPDYIIEKKQIPIFFIEVKDIGDTDLHGTKKTGNKEQFDRYKSSLNQIIFSDYLNFLFYKDGELKTEIAIARQNGGKIEAIPENFPQFSHLIQDFSCTITATIKSPKRLAEMMASKARMLADVIEQALSSDEAQQHNTSLWGQMEAFRQVLIHDIDARQFADIYAQTIAYGMFAARLNDPTPQDFTRQEAATLIPKSNPFLRTLFQYISGYDLDERIEWIVNDLADVFRATDVAELLKNFGRATQTLDPFIHFYEDFLAEYDPKLRKQRGVWYTPEPVVQFIVRAVDDILKTEFALPQGLASTEKTTIRREATGTAITKGKGKGKAIVEEKQVHKVQILDPATGTGTFLAEVVRYIYQNRFATKQGVWSSYVDNDLIPRLNGFELLMASYAMAHLKLELLLKDTGYTAGKEQRLRVYLTNSLEEHHPDTGSLFASFLANEANEANHIKRDNPVMVVMGNPPYSGESANKGDWIMGLMEDYKKEPDSTEKLKEKNPKWINDDYVKFMRYGQHFIEKNGEGILAFINPHGFLDNPTFRGMRWHLLNTYDKIYTIDLHGNAKKKETAPDGGRDENVFDIMQGVSINLLIKTGKKKKNELAKVYHYDLFGLRADKYEFLKNNSLADIDFTLLENKSPNYFMVQKDLGLQSQFNQGFSISELMPTNTVGIVTSRDDFVIDIKKEELIKKMQDFFLLDKNLLKNKYNLKENSNWKIDDIKNKLKLFDVNFIEKINYRPFDIRYVYFKNEMIERSRYNIMKNFILENNFGIVFKLGNSEENSVSSMITNTIIDFRSWSRAGMQGGDYIAPLYLYSEIENREGLNFDEVKKLRKPNFNAEVIQQIAKNLNLTFLPDHEHEAAGSDGTFTPLDVLDYIYAVLHSPHYRETYKEFLKIDFPRVPYPTDSAQFFQLAALGGELRQIHLLQHPSIFDYRTGYPQNGDNTITRKMSKNSPGYQADHTDTESATESGKVWINDQQYFDHVPRVAWEFFIGGYQPAQKWLKDRHGMTLSHDDIDHYQQIIEALCHTDRLMTAIDPILNP